MTTSTMEPATLVGGTRPVCAPGAQSHRDQLIRKLYDNHAAALRAYVTALLRGDQHSAEDVVQETVLRAWQHADRLDASSNSFRPWLLTVARRLVIDNHRKRAARPAEVGGEAPEWLAQADDSDRTLSSMVVSDALVGLSPIHREVINEVYYRGSGVEEAARALGIPPGTVKSRTYYAMRELRLVLEKRGLTGRE